ncbi:Hypothetical protein CINCED_3A011358 [Cinara cedri]|uniref:Uncharacterized protein n=1 Tax=Cinara cedri TaxID=506608 RepID=A0A5E4MQF9_9HEMI|nr:Hypothetical protein CINCED_3A011358 [Cinara cedri]
MVPRTLAARTAACVRRPDGRITRGRTRNLFTRARARFKKRIQFIIHNVAAIPALCARNEIDSRPPAITVSRDRNFALERRDARHTRTRIVAAVAAAALSAAAVTPRLIGTGCSVRIVRGGTAGLASTERKPVTK